MIAGIAQFQQALWAANVAAGVALLILLAVRRHFGTYPAFGLYMVATVSQAGLLFITYRRWGFSSLTAWRIAWGMQGAVICLRVLAVAEVSRHLLACYRGIWAFAWRILLACAALTVLYSLATAKHKWVLAVHTAGRGLDLAIAVVIVALLSFVRYYEVKTSLAARSLAVGFCLYSCFSALNNTFLERYLYNYATLWNLLGMLAFLASLLLWTWAFRKPQIEAGTEQTLLPAGVYQTVAPRINRRLRLLNEQLGQFWNVEIKGEREDRVEREAET